MSFKFTKSNLNFDVYTVASKPTAPGANNDIAIITSVSMPNWIMSPDKPSGIPRSDGDVWIQYSVSGKTFNALKNNSMMVATIKAWQYVDGAWTEVEAVSCQNGEWVDWVEYLIKGANLCEGITGGWTAHAKGWASSNNNPSMPVITKNSDSITIQLNNTGWACGIYVINNKINLDNIDKISINGFGNDVESGGGSLGLVVLSALGTYANDNYVKSVSIGTEDKMYELPVAELMGEYVIGVRLLSTNVLAASTTIKEIRME